MSTVHKFANDRSCPLFTVLVRILAGDARSFSSPCAQAMARGGASNARPSHRVCLHGCSALVAMHATPRRVSLFMCLCLQIHVWTMGLDQDSYRRSTRRPFWSPPLLHSSSGHPGPISWVMLSSFQPFLSNVHPSAHPPTTAPILAQSILPSMHPFNHPPILWDIISGFQPSHPFNNLGYHS